MQDVDLTTPPAAEAALPPPRDQEGDLNPAFVTAVAEAVEAHDGARVRALMADVHEADVGDLLEALDPSCPLDTQHRLGERTIFAAHFIVGKRILRVAARNRRF